MGAARLLSVVPARVTEVMLRTGGLQTVVIRLILLVAVCCCASDDAVGHNDAIAPLTTRDLESRLKTAEQTTGGPTVSWTKPRIQARANYVKQLSTVSMPEGAELLQTIAKLRQDSVAQKQTIAKLKQDSVAQ